MKVKYPNIHVDLVGQDGNAFSIMGRVAGAMRSALREEGLSSVEINQQVDEYYKEATSGDYDNLLFVTMNWVNCD